MQARQEHDEPAGPHRPLDGDGGLSGGDGGAAVGESARRGLAPGRSAAAARGWGLGGRLRGLGFGWLEVSFVVVVAAALGLRLWELSGRTMHYDEAIHVHFAFKLANSPGAALGWPWIFGSDYIHSAWMHGPFQIEMVAAIFTLLGDSDFTSRLGYALFGAGLVALPYFLRDQIGRRAALIAAALLAVSPALLYFSRFGRNDIIMMFWAVGLFVLMWRYMGWGGGTAGGGDRWVGRHICLYLAAAVLAFMFATKETAYLLAAIFGVMLLAAALPELADWARRRGALRLEGTPLAALLLLVTLTLPQWSASIGMIQGPLGLTLANPDPSTGDNVANADGSKGMTGAPAWEGSAMPFPVVDVPWPVHAVVVAVGLLVLLWLLRRSSGSGASGGRGLSGVGGRGGAEGRMAGMVGLPLMSVLACCWLLFRPYSALGSGGVALQIADVVMIVLSVAAAVVCARSGRFTARRAAAMALIPAGLAAVYSLLFTPALDVPGVVNAVLPGGATVPGAGDGLPVNYVVAAVMLLGTLAVSAAVGIWWLGRVWLICAAVFYIIWAALYTTLFTNLSGLFTGSWQGMGYWIAQQEVARGNQPWYYYFVGLSVYELLPLVFGIAGAVYFYRRRDGLGLALAAWAGLSLAAYTVAAEKMPWLLVNITAPFILLAAGFLGKLADDIPWRGIWGRGGLLTAALLALTPLVAGMGVYLFLQYIDPERAFGAEHWLLLASVVVAALVGAYIYRVSGLVGGFPGATAAAGLGIAALLLGVGVWGAFRAAYTFDDSNVELMVYSQGAADLQDTYQTLRQEVYPLPDGVESVKVDYDLWYPFQWYVRDYTRDGRMAFRCFEASPEEDPNCITLAGSREADGGYKFGNPGGLLVKDGHAGDDGEVRESYRRDGPHRNLLWFPETYRRPDENREEEAMTLQLVRDFGFFGEVATSRQSWADALNYLIFRKLEKDWYTANYYSYLP